MGHDDLEPNTKSSSLKETQVLKEMPTLSSGTLLIGRFEILSKQGCGRYGCVYKAKDLQLDTVIAIKVLHRHLLDESNLQNFKNEILTLRQLSHPNIVRVHEYYQDGDTYFITMDWIEGRDLAQIIESRDNAVSVEKALSYAEQIVDALLVTEQKGINHCDLKPENILIDAEDRVYVADFGVASALGSSGDDSIQGTPIYASPEYLELGQTNKTTDIYSFGVILFELITGHTPFDSTTMKELLAEKVSGSFSKLPKKYGSISSLVASCLAAEPRKRPQSLTALSESLNALDTSGEKSSRKLVVTLALSSLLVLFVVGGYYLMFKPEQSGNLVATEDSQVVNQAVAVLPFKAKGMAKQLWLTQGLPAVLSQELSQSPQLRVVNTVRTQQTMDLLGYSRELNQQKLITLSDLLQTPVLLDTEVTLVGPGKYRINADAVEVTGKNVNRIQLVEFEANEEELSQELIQITTALNDIFNVENISEQVAFPEGLSLQKWSEVEFLIEQGKEGRASELLDSIITEFPSFAQAYYLKGQLLSQVGQLAEAESAFKKVNELTESTQLVRQLSTAELLLINDDLSSAADVYQNILERLPKRDDIRFELAQLHIALEQLEEAEKELNRIVSSDANHPVAWYELSKVAIWRGETEKAVDDYLVKALVTAKKLKNDQLRGDVLNAFGVAYHRLGELDLSLDYYQQGLKARKSVNDGRGIVTSLSNLASIYAVKGQYDKAEQSLYEALEVNKPRNDALKQADLFNELGVIAEEQGHYSKALEHFRASLSIRMKLEDDWLKAESLNNVAYIYYLLSDEEHSTIYWDQARDYYEKVKDPVGVIRVNENVGQLSLRKGDWQTAFQIFSKAKESSETLNLFEEKIVAEAYLAKLALLKGNFEAPLEKLEEIRTALQKREDIRGQIEFGVWLLDWNIISGNYKKANNISKSVESLISQEHNLSQQVNFHVLKSRLDLYENNKDSFDEAALPSLDSLTSKASLEFLMFKLERLIFSGNFSSADFQTLFSQIEGYDLALHQFARLEYLQLKAVYYIQTNNHQKLKEVIASLSQLQRNLGSHWSDFFTERLVSIHHQINNNPDWEQHQQIALVKFKELIEELPEEQQQNLISLQGRYKFSDDFMEKLL